MSQKNAHPQAPGQAVSIFGRDTFGLPFLEGRAIIEAPDDRPHIYRVRFIGERVTRLRFVNPDWQQDPAQALALLTEFWRATTSPSVDDFFPNAIAHGDQR